MRIGHLCASLLTGCLLAASPALAQSEPDPLWPEIARDAFELRDLAHPDVDTTETAAVFSNPGAGRSAVRCVAYDQDGTLLGRGMVTVPGRGLRYLRASDLSNGTDFVGQLLCRTAGHLVGSAFLLGPGGPTDLPVRQWTHEGLTRIRIPVAVSF